MALARARVVVSGRVQGVFFRASTQDAALEIGVNGWVRNLPDGRVEALFEGEREKVEKVIQWCGQGPQFSSVTNVEVSWEEYKGDLQDFIIRYWIFF